MNYISKSNSQKDPGDGLPKQFLSSLRILFDILDENQTGFVRLRDIESRWSDDGVRGLPPGVVDGLRKVTPSSGLLSFDRFVAGLKLVLTKKKEANTTEARKPFSSKENRLPFHAEHHDYGRRDRSLPRTTSDTSNNRTGNEVRYGARAIQSNTYRDQDNFPHQRQYHQTVPTKTSDSNDSNYYGNRQIESNKTAGQTNVHEAMHSSQTVNTETKIIKTNGGYSSHQSVNSRHPLPSSHYDKPPQVPPRNEQPSSSRVRETTQLKKSLSGPDLHSQPQQPPAVPPRDKQASTRILSELKNWQKEWASNDKMYNRDREKLNQPRLNSDQDNTIYGKLDINIK